MHNLYRWPPQHAIASYSTGKNLIYALLVVKVSVYNYAYGSLGPLLYICMGMN